jgi:hypothetical protein
VFAQSVDVYIVDIPWIAREQVCEAKDCSLGRIEELLITSRAGLT